MPQAIRHSRPGTLYSNINIIMWRLVSNVIQRIEMYPLSLIILECTRTKNLVALGLIGQPDLQILKTMKTHGRHKSRETGYQKMRTGTHANEHTKLNYLIK